MNTVGMFNAPAEQQLVVAPVYMATEEQRCYEWRLDRFTELHLEPDEAHVLAGSLVDWHDVDRLVRAGCPARVAAKILL